VLLSETANAIGLRFTGVGLALSRLLFDPVELLEEPERLRKTVSARSGRGEQITEASRTNRQRNRPSQKRGPIGRLKGWFGFLGKGIATLIDEDFDDPSGFRNRHRRCEPMGCAHCRKWRDDLTRSRT
jgi:hypothetical protein